MSSWHRAQAVNSLQLQLCSCRPGAFSPTAPELSVSPGRSSVGVLLAHGSRSSHSHCPPPAPLPRPSRAPIGPQLPPAASATFLQLPMCSRPLFTAHFSADSVWLGVSFILNGRCSHCSPSPGCRLLAWEAELRGSPDPQRFLRRLSSCCGAGPSGLGALPSFLTMTP